MEVFKKKCLEVKTAAEAHLQELREHRIGASSEALSKVYRIGVLIAEFFLKEGLPSRPWWWWALRKVPALLADIIKIIME